MNFLLANLPNNGKLTGLDEKGTLVVEQPGAYALNETNRMPDALSSSLLQEKFSLTPTLNSPSSSLCNDLK